MTREQLITVLRHHAPELKAAGVVSASLFGSAARGEPDPGDVDIAVRLDETFSTGGFDYFWRREQLRERLTKLLDCKVDVVEEPVRKPSLRQAIDRDRVLASDKQVRRLLDIIENAEAIALYSRNGRKSLSRQYTRLRRGRALS